MRFATRTFLWSFIPFAFLLLGSFWAIQKLVEHTVRDGLRSSLRQTHLSIARVRSENELQNSRFLKMLGENATLKAGLKLILAILAVFVLLVGYGQWEFFHQPITEKATITLTPNVSSSPSPTVK